MGIFVHRKKYRKNDAGFLKKNQENGCWTGYQLDHTADLYLDMLRAAQHIEDHKLISMLRERLKDKVRKISPVSDRGQVIPFPCPMLPPLSVQPERQLWPRQPGIQGLSIFGGYCSLIVLSLLFG